MKSKLLLSEDHATIQRALNVLEAMILQVECGHQANEGDVKHVVEFLKSFGDSHHQGMEENVLFPALLRGRSQKNYTELCPLIFEHNRQRTLIAGIANSMASRKARDFVYYGSHLVQILRQHLKDEDEVLLALMASTLSPADDEKVFRDMKAYDREWQEKDLLVILSSLDNLESKYLRKALIAAI
jgi:hemerythrin-like domain-containing protein